MLWATERERSEVYGDDGIREDLVNVSMRPSAGPVTVLSALDPRHSQNNPLNSVLSFSLPDEEMGAQREARKVIPRFQL